MATMGGKFTFSLFFHGHNSYLSHLDSKNSTYEYVMPFFCGFRSKFHGSLHSFKSTSKNKTLNSTLQPYNIWALIKIQKKPCREPSLDSLLFVFVFVFFRGQDSLLDPIIVLCYNVVPVYTDFHLYGYVQQLIFVSDFFFLCFCHPDESVKKFFHFQCECDT